MSINQLDIHHRNQVLRAYFKGRDWDKNNEYSLKRFLVENSLELLPKYPYLFDDEWEVESSRAEQGRGDLIFTDGSGNYAVVEVKWIDLKGPTDQRSSSTRRTSNRKKRRVVEEQAKNYSHNLASLLGDFVSIEGYSYTNESESLQHQITLPIDSFAK